MFTSSFAQAQTWTGGGANNSWTTSGNWSGGVPANNGTANLTFSGSVRPITQADTVWAFSGLSFSAGAAAFILNGSDLTIGTGGITNSSSNRQTVDNRITLSAAQTWNAGSAAGGELLIENAIGNGGFVLTVTGTNAVTIDGAVSGAGGIVKSGLGTLTLGSASNSYGGGTELSGGIVSVGANGALGNAAGTLFFKGGTLEITGTTFTSTARAISWGTGGGGFKVADASNTFTVGQSLSGSGVLSKTGPGTLVLSGTNTYTGQTTVSEGILRLAGGNAIANSGTVALTNASGVTLDLNNTSETVGSITGGGLSGGNISLGSGTLTVGGGDFAGVISGAGGSLAATTSPLLVKGANTFTGGTTISSGGSIWVKAGGALGTGVIAVTGNGTYNDLANAIVFERSGALGGAAATPTQAITVNSAGFITSLNSFTTLGAVTLNGGIMETEGGESAAHQAFFLRGTVTVQPSAATAFIRPYSPATPNAGIHLLSGASGGTTFDVANGSAANDLVVTAKLIDPPAEAAGTGSVIKTGAGNMQLGGANTYSGETRVDAGTLEVSGTGSVSATSLITVNNGGTLLLSGNIATNKINDAAAVNLNGGTFNVGGLSGLDEQVGTLTLSSTSTLDFGAASTSESLRFGDSHTATWAGRLNVWNWTGGVDHLYVGTDFGGLTASQLAQVRFYSDSGSTLLADGAAFAGMGEITPVPEASTVYVAVGLFGLIGWRERRKARRLRIVLNCALFGSLAGIGWTHGDVDEAIAAATQQIAAQPADAKLYLRRGGLHRMHRDWIAAGADFDKALTLDPQLIVAELMRGEMLCEAGRAKEAKQPLDRFLAQRPQDSAGHAARARAFAAAAEWSAAAEDFAQAIAFGPAPDPALFIERAGTLRAAGKMDDAIRALDDGIARLGPLITLVQLAIDLEAEGGHVDAALARLAKVVEATPRKERWLLRRGELLEKSGQRAAAHDAYTAAQAALAKVSTARRATPATQEVSRAIAAALIRVAPGS